MNTNINNNTTPLLPTVAVDVTAAKHNINKQQLSLLIQSAKNPSTIPVSLLAILTCTIFFITIILSWLGFGLTYGNLFPLPTISTTWDYPPFNFISRIVVGIGSTSFVLLHLTIYYATQDKIGSCFLLFLGLFGALCLAFLGAICSSDVSPECLGQPAWHATVAVIFFVVQDVFQILISIRDKKYVVAVLVTIPAVLHSGMKFVQFEDPIPDPPGLAEFEWFNVGIIFGFMVYYTVYNCSHFHVGFFDISMSRRNTDMMSKETSITRTTTTTPIPVWFVSGNMTGAITVTIGLVVMLVSYCIATLRGDFPIFPQHTPEISTLFIHVPGNYLGRFFGVQGANTMAIFLVIAIRVLKWQPIYAIIDMGVANILVVICAVSLASALCVNNVESNFYHYLFVGWFFMTWTILLCVWFAPMDSQSKIFALISLITKIRVVLPVDWDQIFNMMECMDVLSGLVWIGLFAWLHNEKMSRASFGLLLVNNKMSNNNNNI
jgi:hypothetical protein